MPKKSKTSGVTKTQMIAQMVEMTGLTRTQIIDVFTQLFTLVEKELKAGNSVIIPDLVKIVIKHVPAKKARTCLKPGTTETIHVKAKPACKKVKVRVLKKLKEIGA